MSLPAKRCAPARHVGAGTLLLVCITHCPPAAADSNDSLEDVVVTATRTPTALGEVPASVSVVSADQIRSIAAQGLDEVLQHVPGINFTMMGPNVGHPTSYNEGMRGLSTTSTRLLLLVDGVPLNDPFFGYIQWNRIPLGNIDRVEVVRGGGAALWGNGAMGGVINVLTKPPETQGVDLEAAGGNYGTYRGGGNGTYFAGGHAKLGLNAAVSGTSGYQTTPPSWDSFGTTTLRSPLYTPTSFDAQNVGLRADFDPMPGLSVYLDVRYFHDHQTLATPIGDNEQRTWSYTLGLKQEVGSASVLNGTVFHSGSRFTTDNPHLLTFTAEYDSNVHTTPVNDTGASLVWTSNPAGPVRDYAVGADFHSIRGTDRTDYLDPSGALLVPTIVGGGEQLFAGVFAQVSVFPVSSLEIQASAREQYFENRDGVDTFPPAIGAIPSSSETSFDPRVNVRYRLASQWALRGAYYRSFRAPTLDQLYRTYADTTAGIYEGNPYLKPERLAGGEVGIDFGSPGIRSQLTFYSTRIRNLITQYGLSASDSPPGLNVTCGYDAATFTYLTCTRNINSASAVARGVEEELTWRIGAGFSGTIAYTYADSHYTSNPVDPTAVGQRLEGVPRHHASAGLTYVAPSGWQAATQLSWVSASYGDAHPEDNLIQQAHFVVDAAAEYPLTRNLRAFVQAQNLLDRRYIANSSGGAPILGTPFEVMAGIRMRVD